MPQKKDNEVVDPLVLAAMIEEPDEDEDIKKLREDMLGTDETVPAKSGKPSDDEEETEDEDDEEDPDDKKDKGDKKPKSDEDQEDDDQEEDPQPKPKKPVEAEDDPVEDEEDNPDDKGEKKTRRERRQERQEDFLASIRKDNAKSSRNPNIPAYNPLNYENQPVDDEGKPREYKPEELVQDREMYGAVAFAQGAKQVKEAAEQDQFWRDLNSEAKILSYDPTLSFLSETTPDGKKNPDFDPDKAEEINSLYLQLCGAQQFYARDRSGRVIVNEQTGQPVTVIRVGRTDLSYEKFAKRYVERMQDWAEDFADDRVEQTKDNLTKQRKNQSIRPGGGKRKTLGAINPGDVTRMSDEDFDKNEDAINKQIDEMLGI